MTLEDRLLGGGGSTARIYRDIGVQLAHIHRITFPRTGFVGPKVAVGHEYDDFSVFLRQFINRTLRQLHPVNSAAFGPSRWRGGRYA